MEDTIRNNDEIVELTENVETTSESTKKRGRKKKADVHVDKDVFVTEQKDEEVVTVVETVTEDFVAEESEPVVEPVTDDFVVENKEEHNAEKGQKTKSDKVSVEFIQLNRPTKLYNVFGGSGSWKLVSGKATVLEEFRDNWYRVRANMRGQGGIEGFICVRGGRS